MVPSIATRDMWPAVIGAIFIQLVVGLFALRLLAPGRDGGPATSLLAYLVLPSLAAIAWIWFAAVWSEQGGWARLGFAWTPRRWLVGAAALGLVSVPATMLITALAEPLVGPHGESALPLSMEQAWGQPSFLLMLLLGVVVLAPLMEEIVFRGLLYGWLRQRQGLWLAAALSALIHALLHLDLGALPGLFALFLFLAWIYEYSHSLWVPSIVHAAHNLITLLLP